MLDWLRYRYKLARLHAEKKKTALSNAKALRLAKRGKRPPPSLQGRDARLIDDDIAQLESDYQQRVAERLLISIPRFRTQSDKWEKSPFAEPERWRLTRDTMIELRSAIRAERKERSDLARSWLTSITGLVGVLIGLLAIILGRR